MRHQASKPPLFNRMVGMGSEKPRQSWNRTWQEAQIITRDYISSQVTKNYQGECMLPDKKELVATDMEKAEVLSCLSHHGQSGLPPTSL